MTQNPFDVPDSADERAATWSEPAEGSTAPDPYAAPDQSASPAQPAYGQPQQPYAGTLPAYQAEPAYQAVQPGYQQPQAAYASAQAPSGAAQPMYGSYAGPARPAKSKVVAAILAFFLGTLGVHNFYRGQVKRGVGHVLLTVAAVVLLVVGVVVAVWSTGSASGYAPDGTAEVSDGAALALGGAWMLALLVHAVNALWAFVEFILILMSSDGSLE